MEGSITRDDGLITCPEKGEALEREIKATVIGVLWDCEGKVVDLHMVPVLHPLLGGYI